MDYTKYVYKIGYYSRIETGDEYCDDGLVIATNLEEAIEKIKKAEYQNVPQHMKESKKIVTIITKIERLGVAIE